MKIYDKLFINGQNGSHPLENHQWEEALRIANDTIYGLAGGVWSGDEVKAHSFARRMRTAKWTSTVEPSIFRRPLEATNSLVVAESWVNSAWRSSWRSSPSSSNNNIDTHSPEVVFKELSASAKAYERKVT